MSSIKEKMVEELESMGTLKFHSDGIEFKSSTIGFRYRKKGLDEVAILSDLLKLARWAHGK